MRYFVEKTVNSPRTLPDSLAAWGFALKTLASEHFGFFQKAARKNFATLDIFCSVLET